MPHVIIEYAQPVAKNKSLDSMLLAIHQAVIDSGLFDENNIKTRLIPVTTYRIGNGKDTYLSVQLRIHSGRNEAQKKALSHAVLEAIRQQAWPVSVVTVEVVDMDRSSYAKYTMYD